MKKILSISVTLIMLALLSVSAFAAVGDNLAPSATVTAPYVSPWENSAALNDGVKPTKSDEATAGAEGVTARYGSWGGAQSNFETVAYTWEAAVTVDSVGIFFATNVSHDDWVATGGLCIPASYTIQYWNGTEYVNVTGGTGYVTAPDVVNVTKFDAVTTTSIQVTFTKFTDAELTSDAMNAEIANIQTWYDTEYPDENRTATADDVLAYRGIGLYEIEVYEAAAKSEQTDNQNNQDKVEPDNQSKGEEKAPQTSVAIVALATLAVVSGAYIASRKH